MGSVFFTGSGTLINGWKLTLESFYLALLSGLNFTKHVDGLQLAMYSEKKMANAKTIKISCQETICSLSWRLCFAMKHSGFVAWQKLFKTSPFSERVEFIRKSFSLSKTCESKRCSPVWFTDPRASALELKIKMFDFNRLM